MGFTAGDFVARSLRPARFVVAPSQGGVDPFALRLRLGGLGDKCEQVAAHVRDMPLSKGADDEPCPF